MNITDRLHALQRRYAIAVRQKKSRERIAGEMVQLKLRQLRREIRDDRRLKRLTTPHSTSQGHAS